MFSYTASVKAMYTAVRYFVTVHHVLYLLPLYMCFYSSPFDFRTKVAVNLFPADENEVCKVMKVDKMLRFGHRGFSFEQ